MRYTKHTITLVLSEEESEVVTQGLMNALDRLEEAQGVTIYSTDWQEEDTPEPANAAEISAAAE